MTLQLPAAPIEGLGLLLHNLTLPVHPLVPYVRFPVLHSVRVSIVWAGMTAARHRAVQASKKVGVLQDLFGYLVVAWGGATLSSLLLSRPPAWLFSPLPWIIYPSTYLIFLHPSSPFPLARIITALIPAPALDLLGAYIDGITRGSTVALLTHSVTPLSLSTTGTVEKENDIDLSPVGAAVLSGIAISGGGWIVQTLGLNLEEWSVGTPAVLKHGAGVLETLDTWSAVVCSIIYSILVASPTLGSGSGAGPARSTTEGRTRTVISPAVDEFVRSLVPPIASGGKVFGINAKVLDNTITARSVVVLLMGSILAARVITKLVLATQTPSSVSTSSPSTPNKAAEPKETSAEQVEVQGTTSSRAGTPRKRKATPKKSPGPK